jgi:hypothetical protein
VSTTYILNNLHQLRSKSANPSTLFIIIYAKCIFVFILMKPSSINYYVLNWSTLLGSEQTFHLRFFFIKWAFNSNNVFKYEQYSVLKSHAIHYHITCPFCIGTSIFLLHSVLAHWSSCFILYWPFPFSTVLSYIVVFNFIYGGNRSIWRKPPTFRKPLTNLITYCFIEYIRQEWGSHSQP